MIHKLAEWFRAIGRWLWQGRKGWAPLVLVAITIFMCIFLARTTSDGLRFAGVILQLLGVVTVAIGLRDRRQTFQRPSFYQRFVQWLRSFPKYSPKPHILEMRGVASASMGGSAYAFGWQGTPPGATVDQRFAVIEKNLETVKQLALDAQKQNQESASKIREELDAERRERSASDQALRLKVENIGAGNLNLEAAGVFWLIVGITLGTIPNEVANFFGLRP